MEIPSTSSSPLLRIAATVVSEAELSEREILPVPRESTIFSLPLFVKVAASVLPFKSSVMSCAAATVNADEEPLSSFTVSPFLAPSISSCAFCAVVSARAFRSVRRNPPPAIPLSAREQHKGKAKIFNAFFMFFLLKLQSNFSDPPYRP